VLQMWSVRGGPSGNRPVYGSSMNNSEFPPGLGLRFTPCNVTNEYHACAKDLPWVRLDVEVPFDFTKVRGSFIEYSDGPNHADDCRAGTNHSSWEDTQAYRYWSLIKPGFRAEGEDCPRVGGGNLSSNISWQNGATSRATSREACQAECEAMGFCNFVNWRTRPQSCDLRRCLDATNPRLTISPDDEPWAFVLRDEAHERIEPSHDGYVMFGAPDTTGNGGILYGGCSAGPDIPSVGVQITVQETMVAKTRHLRWQVAQSRNTETLGIRAVSLELWRPVEGRTSISVESSSPLVAFSPARRELTVALGDGADMAVWDLRGIDFPAAFQGERLLKKAFSFDIEATGLLEIDRVRVVDAAVVPVCGDGFSATSSPTLQGLGDGRRDDGLHNYSLWDEVVATSPGEYRICFCGGRRTSCCIQDSDFATQIFTFVVAGAANDHYAICEVRTGGGTLPCVIENFHGTGIKDGDRLMVQDAPACGLATGPIPGLPNDGVMIARQPEVPRDADSPQASGAWYRFESKIPGSNAYFIESIDGDVGRVARLCWCPLAANCVASDPSMFRIPAGILSMIRFERLTTARCEIGKNCLVTFEGEPYNTPVAVSDLIMIKTGPAPGNVLATRDDPNVCIGSIVKGVGPDGDGMSARMKVGFDIRKDAPITDRELGLFDLGTTASTTPIGNFRICWCQASIRPCNDPSDFVADIGQLTVLQAAYVWPDCANKETPFTGWRIWPTFDDCCCNHNEAGTVGCNSIKTETFARCSKLPRR